MIDTLIYDRTSQDVSSGTDKGYYNATDLNRVGEALLYLQDELNGYGYAVTVTPKTDWAMADIPTIPQMETYLTNVAAIRSVLEVFKTTPHPPETMEKLTFQRANDIEKILADVQKLLTNMQAAFRHCGAAVCGGGGLLVR